MKQLPFIAFSLGLCLVPFSSASGQASAKSEPAFKGMSVIKGMRMVGAVLPSLALPDVAGRRHSLSEMKQPVALLFFCGCTPCHEFARLWSQVQQSGELTRQTAAHSPSTVVVFFGDAADARTFAAQTGLDLSQTLLLLDPSDQAGQRFGVLQCPRIFVADTMRRLVYTNPDANAPALLSSAPALVSRTLTAWRHLPAQKKANP